MKSFLDQLSIDRFRARYLFGCLWRMAKVCRNVLFILMGNIIGGGLLISLLDEKTIFEGQYLAFITAMSIGYGDLAPVSGIARIVSIFIGFNGLILTGVTVAMIVKALELAFQEEARRLEAFEGNESEQGMEESSGSDT